MEKSKKLIQWEYLSGDDYLFCNICLTKQGYKVRNSYRKMSNTNLRDLQNVFIETLKPNVSDLKLYCLHSLG